MSARADKAPPPDTWLATCDLQGGPKALSLLSATPAGSSQSAETPAVQVIFSGVLYNRDELIRLLELAPDPSEALVVAKAYERWGEGFPLKLKGIFAVAVWDRESRTLLCARDPMGIYPLYYSETGRELVLSTSVDELVGHPCVSRELNRAALADHLLHRWPDAGETFYRKARRLLPGHLLRVTDGHRRSARYWDPLPAGRPVNWISEDELIRFDELFAQAVERCLLLGSAGIYLSGGLDSVSVAALAVEQSRRMGLRAPWALSLVFPDPECNEEAIQCGVARALGMPQQVLPFEAAVDGSWLRVSLEMSSGWPEPLLNPWLAVYHQLAREAPARGCRIILTGTGGDEWLGVTPCLAADLLRALDFRGIWKLWEAHQRSFRVPKVVLLQRLLWRFGLRPLVKEWVLNAPGGRLARRLRSALRREASAGMPPWLAPDPDLRKELADRRRCVEASNQDGSYYLQEVRAGFEHRLTTWEMEEHFESGRRLGVWLLHPFCDPDLVDFLCRVPPLLLNQGGRSKGLVREWVARKFPHLGFERQKKILVTNFFRAKVLAEAPMVWEALGGTQALTALGVLEPRGTSLLLEKILSEVPIEAYRIWDMLNIEVWTRTHVRMVRAQGGHYA